MHLNVIGNYGKTYLAKKLVSDGTQQRTLSTHMMNGGRLKSTWENSDVSKFRKKGIGPDMMEKLNRMFSTVTAGGGNAYAPALALRPSEEVEESRNVVNEIDSSDDTDDDSSQLKANKGVKVVECVEGKNKKRDGD